MSIKEWLKSLKQKLVYSLLQNEKELDTEITIQISDREYERPDGGRETICGSTYKSKLRSLAVIETTYMGDKEFLFCARKDTLDRLPQNKPNNSTTWKTIDMKKNYNEMHGIQANESNCFKDLINDIEFPISQGNYESAYDIRSFFPYEYLKRRNFILTDRDIFDVFNMGEPINRKKKLA